METINENNESTKAVQIVRVVDHKFEVLERSLNRIVESNNLEDHNLVILSIAGAFRKGKSFLMNFFLKYLNAQVRIDC